MDYVSRFGLEFNPFLKNSKDITIENDEFKEVQFRLRLLAETKGFGLLTGTPGLGKTTALRSFASSLNPSAYKVIYSSLSTLTVQDFYKSLVLNLGEEPRHRKVDNFEIIQDTINRLSIEKRITPVLILDEADHISSAILSDLKILFNFEMDSRDRAVIILAGHPQINNTLRMASQEALRQRLLMNYNMEGLTKEEGRIYILEKLKGAGCKQNVFEPPAIEAVLNSANGVPRLINRICDTAMILASNMGQNIITADTTMAAINDIQLG